LIFFSKIRSILPRELAQQLGGICNTAKIQQPVKIKPCGALHAKKASVLLQNALTACEPPLTKGTSAVIRIIFPV
jgi:hypothetical protein